MKYFLAMGSPRKKGNTNALCEVFKNQLKQQGDTLKEVWLYDKVITPCIACRTCQKDWTIFGCPFQDDLHEIFQMIMDSDGIILATPIYSWYCTPPMKSMLDRLVYGMNKYYGEKKGPSLWKGKSLSLITTCGYSPEKGADLFESGMKRYAKHSDLVYQSMLCERDLGYSSTFMDEKKAKNAIEFAKALQLAHQ